MSYEAYVMDYDGTIRKLIAGTNDPNQSNAWTFRNEEVSFLSVTHPRKIYVEFVTGHPGWKQEFFASVINAGIWDIENEIWTFAPEWEHPDNPTK